LVVPEDRRRTETGAGRVRTRGDSGEKLTLGDLVGGNQSARHIVRRTVSEKNTPLGGLEPSGKALLTGERGKGT